MSSSGRSAPRPGAWASPAIDGLEVRGPSTVWPPWPQGDSSPSLSCKVRTPSWLPASGCLAWGVLAFGFDSVLQGEQKTPAGRAAAAHWGGVRAALRSDAALTTLSPAAIAIWGRRLAYGAVFGAAPAAVTALSPPPKDRAWSSHGGRWRLVRIGSHSERIPPVLSLYLAVLFGLVGLFFLLMVVRLGLSGRHDDGLALAAGFVPPVIVLISTVAAVGMGRSFLKGVTGPSQVEIVGQVVKRWVESVLRDDRNVEYPCVGSTTAGPPMPTLGSFRGPPTARSRSPASCGFGRTHGGTPFSVSKSSNSHGSWSRAVARPAAGKALPRPGTCRRWT
jgi:hypothetical protein